MREQLARDLIGEQLEALQLEASYTVQDISPERQSLTSVVVGDPRNPDLTAERVEISLAYGMGIPKIGRIKLVKPRLYGTYRDGRLSFGALDTVLFAESEGPVGLPEWDIELVEGRGLIESDYGDIGLKAEGSGPLNNGFKGVVAAIAPKVELGGCEVDRASMFGDISTRSGRIAFRGPLRVSKLECTSNKMALHSFRYEPDVEISADFDSIGFDGVFAAGRLQSEGASSSGASGPLRLSYSAGQFDAAFSPIVLDIVSGQIRASAAKFDGTLRADSDFVNAELRLNAKAEGLAPTQPFVDSLTNASLVVDGTLLQPLLAKIVSALDANLRDAKIEASMVARRSSGALSVVIPQAEMTGRSGQILSATRLQYAQNGVRTPRFSGNFRVGGADLPPLVGRMEVVGVGQSLFRIKMPEYVAGNSSVAIPEMLVTQNAAGVLRFSGSIEASGPLPGGVARGLRMPVSGVWSASSGLSLWNACTQIGFDRLTVANLELSSRDVTLCPVHGRSIVSHDARGLRIAAGMPSLNVSGSLAGTPIRISSGPVGFAYPGAASAKELNISLGPAGEASRFEVSDVRARIEEGIAGSFSGADIGLFSVPIDLQQSSGEWAYRDGVLTIADGQFTLADRAEQPRYAPLVARGASLSLEDNAIRASADLREPASDRIVSSATIQHNLGSGIGLAKLRVDGLTFDDTLQPDQLTEYIKGVAANVRGTIHGAGRIDWNSDAVTSYGAFTSDSLDFAAVFGPVKGASGTVEFTDLLSLTTAPDQRIKVASVNPGIEATDGEIGFRLTDGQYLGVTGGKWPFMGGTLTLRPVDLNLSVAEERRYVLVVEGLDSAMFVANMELSNLAATGVFDGELPIVFDALGFGQIEGGALKSRGGGNVSYVGELTYEDLSPIANYAFNMLKSLDYRAMTIGIEGPLTGDIVTQLEIEGVRQGLGTEQNFITRQLANVPIQFNVNVKAPFYSLFGELRWLYDPSAVRDPRTTGQFSTENGRLIRSQAPSPPIPSEPILPDAMPNPSPNRPDESAIQYSDSEEMP